MSAVCPPSATRARATHSKSACRLFQVRLRSAISPPVSVSRAHAVLRRNSPRTYIFHHRQHTLSPTADDVRRRTPIYAGVDSGSPFEGGKLANKINLRRTPDAMTCASLQHEWMLLEEVIGSAVAQMPSWCRR